MAISALRYHLPISSKPSLSPSIFFLWASRAWPMASVFLRSKTLSSLSIASASRVFRGRVLCNEASCRSIAANSASRSANRDKVAGKDKFWEDEEPSLEFVAAGEYAAWDFLSDAIVFSSFVISAGSSDNRVVSSCTLLYPWSWNVRKETSVKEYQEQKVWITHASQAPCQFFPFLLPLFSHLLFVVVIAVFALLIPLPILHSHYGRQPTAGRPQFRVEISLSWLVRDMKSGVSKIIPGIKKSSYQLLACFHIGKRLFKPCSVSSLPPGTPASDCLGNPLIHPMHALMVIVVFHQDPVRML